MKKIIALLIILLPAITYNGDLAAQDRKLRLVFIRHAEKPADGDNLDCRGLNRSMLLPTVLYKKFGNASGIYVPSLKSGKSTGRARMLQTITPYAVKYNLNINSKYAEEDYEGVAQALLGETGTVIIVWEHHAILPVLKALGVKKTKTMVWNESDFDSILIVTFADGKAILTKDQEGLRPADGCLF